MITEMTNTNRNQMIQLVSDITAPSYEFEWMGIVAQAKDIILLQDMLEFVNDVVELCFDSEGNYVPELYDFAIRREVVMKYTTIEMPDDAEMQYKILFATSLFDIVMEYVNKKQFNEMIRAIDRKLKYTSDARTMQAHAEIQKIVDTFGSLNKNVQVAMEKISDVDLSELFEKLSRIDEHKIVGEYIERTKSTKSEA